MAHTDSMLQIERSIQENDGLLTANYAQYELFSLFQPIFSFAHKRLVGCEGLTRCVDANGRLIPPGRLFGSVRDIGETMFLDRLMRALHVGNYSTRKRDNSWLFLNVSPVVVINGDRQKPFFSELLKKYDFPPHRVVIEVMETSIPDEDALESMVSHYQELGCMVAIDDFGAGHSNFERIWRLKPDIVKLDRIMIQRAAMDPTIQRSLSMIVALVHEIGGLVLAEGIETEKQAIMAVNADVDLVQGFLFSESFNPMATQPDCSELFDSLHDRMIQQNIDEEGDFRRAVQVYVDEFIRTANMLAAGLNIYTATQEMAQMNRVMRFYLLNESGTQIGENISSQHRHNQRDQRLAPLFDTQGANWAHRPYFRRAMARPDEVQLTRPYLSLTDARMCVTLTRVVKLKRERAVLCCDLEWRPQTDDQALSTAAEIQGLFDSKSVPPL